MFHGWVWLIFFFAGDSAVAPASQRVWNESQIYESMNNPELLSSSAKRASKWCGALAAREPSHCE